MMQTLRRILAIARKELLVLMGTRQSRFMVLIPPVIQIFIFAWAATMEVKNVDLIVLNEDSGYWSQEVVSRLRGSPTFRNIMFEDDPKRAEEAIDRQRVLAVLRFQSDFSRRVERGEAAEVQLLLDGTPFQHGADPCAVCSGDRSGGGRGLAGLQMGEARARGDGRTELVQSKSGFSLVHSAEPDRTINFMMGMIITGLTVARERELGTFDQMLVSPASPVEIRLRKADPRMCGRTCARHHLRLFHDLVFQGAVCRFSGLSVRCNAAVFLSVSSIGLMVSSFASTQQQAFLGCFTVAVPCILLSGFMTPINNMPMFLQNLSQLNPLRHFIVILQGLFLKDITLSAALDSCARIAVITAVSMLCAIWMFKRKA